MLFLKAFAQGLRKPSDMVGVVGLFRSAGLGRTRLCHPWGREPEGGVVRRLRSVSHVVGPSQGSGLMGWVGSHWVPSGYVRVWSRIGPYISRTLIRDSRVICQGSSGRVGPYRVTTGFRRNTVLARQDPTGLDGSLDCPVLVHRRTPFTRRLPGLGGPQLLLV